MPPPPDRPARPARLPPSRTGRRVKQILCMKWGTLYGPDYVNRLYAMVARNGTGPFRFICLTDDSDGIRDEVACYPCPEIAVPETHRNKPWRKVSLWASELFDLSGEILFLGQVVNPAS